MELGTTKLRNLAIDIIESGITAVLPENLLRTKINFEAKSRILTVNNDNYDLSSGRLFVIGGGKAAGAMAETIELLIPPEIITDGVVVCHTNNYNTKRIKVIKAGHPIPDDRGVAGVREILKLKDEYRMNEQDTILFLLSGGGSALMPCTIDGVSLNDIQLMTELLIESGASIQEINVIRKKISKIKGGKLGRYFSPTKIISLILSDVIENDLKSIAAGPTVTDTATFEDAFNILKNYDLLSKSPISIKSFIKNNLKIENNSTIQPLDNCYNYVIGDNEIALQAMAAKATDLGLKPKIITKSQIGVTTKVAKERGEEILNGKYIGYDVLLIGGETTPHLPNQHGKGGRNQHYASESIMTMKDYPGEWLMASIATDGSDFLPSIAGALIDNNTISKVKAYGINVKSYIENFDSNTLLTELGESLIKTGITGTNVGDIMLYILK